MRDPYSIEAEHGLLGAMLQRPELIDTLSDDLSAESFYFPENAEVYRAIMAIRSAGKSIDFLTVADHINKLPNGDSALAYCAEIVDNTPSVASASTYAGIVRERAVDRALYELGSQAMDISRGELDTQSKIAAIQAAAMAIDSGTGADEVVKASDVLIEQVEVLRVQHLCIAV